jgi:RecJ-like exonuclease
MLVFCEECNGEGFLLDSLETHICSECGGDQYFDEVQCPACFGDGCSFCLYEGLIYNVPCNKCRGLGETETHPRCYYCNGTGEAPDPDCFRND